jgi:hypothetical protein
MTSLMAARAADWPTIFLVAAIPGDQRGDGEVVDGAGFAAGGVVDLVMAWSENRSFWQSGAWATSPKVCFIRRDRRERSL